MFIRSSLTSGLGRFSNPENSLIRKFPAGTNVSGLTNHHCTPSAIWILGGTSSAPFSSAAIIPTYEGCPISTYLTTPSASWILGGTSSAPFSSTAHPTEHLSLPYVTRVVCSSPFIVKGNCMPRKIRKVCLLSTYMKPMKRHSSCIWLKLSLMMNKKWFSFNVFTPWTWQYKNHQLPRLT